MTETTKALTEEQLTGIKTLTDTLGLTVTGREVVKTTNLATVVMQDGSTLTVDLDTDYTTFIQRAYDKIEQDITNGIRTRALTSPNN